MQQHFEHIEDTLGLRFGFNVLPRSQDQQQRLGAKQAVLYQPLRPKEDLLTLEALPIACSTCRSIINPLATLDNSYQYWGCPICSSRNMVHESQRGVLQYVFDPAAADIEYILPEGTQNVNRNLQVFLLVIDLAVDQEELDSLKESLITSLDYLPPNAIVGLITFGKHVNVYELTNVSLNKVHTLNGAREYTKDDIVKLLAIFPVKNDKSKIDNRFLHTLNQFKPSLINFINELKVDGFKTIKGSRKETCTGSAIQVATILLQSILPKIPSRIVSFIGGPSTNGQGSIVDAPLKNPLRSHNDLKSDSKIKKKYNKSKEFYQMLANDASAHGHSFDIFVGCYDQVGLMEMEPLVNSTGGVIVQSDSFTSAIFKQSLQRFLSPESQFGLNGVLEIKTSGVKLNGLIGNCTKIDPRTVENVAKSEIGVGGTNSWKLGSISNHSTYSIYYELSEEVSSKGFAIFQFITSYNHMDGTKRVHVTTCQKQIVEGVTDMGTICTSIDQEALIVTLAREAVYTLMSDPSIDVLKKCCDKPLIDLLKTFAQYTADVPSSVLLPPNLKLFPQFVYYLRRSNFIQIFNSSPDETTFYRHCFLTEDCSSTLTMIQPSLVSYSLNEDPKPVLLDTSSLKPDTILLLDTFFHILIYHGSTVAEWRREGYHLREEYAYLKEFFDLPRQEAADLLVDRFPLPRFIDTEEGGSQARFLVSKLNPSESYRDNTLSNSVVALTDDVPLQTLLQHVYKAVVAKA